MSFDYEKTFERDGLHFRMRTIRDPYMHEPWKEHDGHGIVSEWTDRAKKPGERVLVKDRDIHRFYDFEETLKIAKRDGWGIEKEKATGMTKAQATAAAVEADFTRMKAWCQDEWWWVVVQVDLLDTDGAAIDRPECQETRGGIESDDEESMEVATQLADEIAARFKDKNEICIPIRKGKEGE